MQRRNFLFGALVAVLVLYPHLSHAQSELVPDTVTIQKAQVLEVTSEPDAPLRGMDVPTEMQTLKVKILDEPDAGSIVTFKNEYIQLSVGDLFYLRHTTSTLDPIDYYSVSAPYRLNVLGALAAVFLLLIIIFGGIQGIRGFASLCGSLVIIFYALIPGILYGYSPILVGIGVSSLIIVVGSYITHGFNRTTSAAVFGMIVTVTLTGIGGYFVVQAAQLSGFNSEEARYLALNTRGAIDLVALLYGGIMIGLLGVLYDIAIGQAISVEELFRAGTHMTRIQVYKRAIRIGREHIGALVNTLAIAYVGAALPLFLLMQNATYGAAYTINTEIFATEIVRILIGGIGLILGVPITTLIASYLLSGQTKSTQTEQRIHLH